MKTQEITMEFYKAAPPITVSGATLFGVSLQDWVLAATLLYTVMQIAFTVYKFIKSRRE